MYVAGFEKLTSLLALFADVELTSELLKEVARVEGSAGFPDLSKLLNFYKVVTNALP